MTAEMIIHLVIALPALALVAHILNALRLKKQSILEKLLHLLGEKLSALADAKREPKNGIDLVFKVKISGAALEQLLFYRTSEAVPLEADPGIPRLALIHVLRAMVTQSARGEKKGLQSSEALSHHFAGGSSNASALPGAASR